ncbi:uncharacterized protein BDV14DRAFT_169848 [Aspergillus stella-maris]|uniref:uncharacterized protein n=1 Tax=Aspergillus stella-maris TaxID=1810926 RepID=UPI003CCD8170
MTATQSLTVWVGGVCVAQQYAYRMSTAGLTASACVLLDPSGFTFRGRLKRPANDLPGYKCAAMAAKFDRLTSGRPRTIVASSQLATIPKYQSMALTQINPASNPKPEPGVRQSSVEPRFQILLNGQLQFSRSRRGGV